MNFLGILKSIFTIRELIRKASLRNVMSYPALKFINSYGLFLKRKTQ